jgi:hypothetical protein
VQGVEALVEEPFVLPGAVLKILQDAVTPVEPCLFPNPAVEVDSVAAEGSLQRFRAEVAVDQPEVVLTMAGGTRSDLPA